MIKIIVGISLNNVIGEKGSKKLLWSSEVDMLFFKNTTEGGVVVMGNDTYKTLGKPLPDRVNVVLSRKEEPGKRNGIIYYNDYREILKDYPAFWVIGGESIYNIFLPVTDEIYITTVSIDFRGNKNYAIFPERYVSKNFRMIHESAVMKDIDRLNKRNINLIFSRWVRRRGALN